MAFSLLWKFGGDAPHEPCFAEIVDEWAENARTNALIETHRQFVDRKVIPLVLREVKNPSASRNLLNLPDDGAIMCLGEV